MESDQIKALAVSLIFNRKMTWESESSMEIVTGAPSPWAGV